MPIIKLNALQKLASLVECNIKELKGKTCAGPGGRDHRLKFPSLAMTPRKFTYEPMQADSNNYVTGQAYGADSPTQDVYQVGTWVGLVELRLGTKTGSQRYSLQEKIERLFLSGGTYEDPLFASSMENQILHPGIVWVDVPECYGARVVFELLDERWANERIYSKEWYTHITIRMLIPAIVPVKASPCLENIGVKLTEDLETEINDAESLPEDTETVFINEP